jgi:protein tyrosine/serine phosphatase
MSTTTTNDANDLLPSPPFHTVPNINNLRDAALFPLSTPTGPIRPSILFRSADVSKLDASGWRSLHSLGVKHVFDLRSAPEVGFTNASSSDAIPSWVGAMQSSGIQRTWVPVFTEKDYSPEGLASRYMKYMDESVAGFVSVYRDILANGGAAYAIILRYLATSPGEGVLVHCTAGKDRTGIFFGVLFAYLGVDREVIADEYNLTEVGLGSVREQVVARLLLSPAFKNYIATQETGQALSAQEIGWLIQEEKEGKNSGGEEVVMSPEARAKGREAALRMVGAKKETMLAALDMLEEEFGGAERYMREVCGLNDEEMRALRRNLVGRDE